jgi:hypothetical protein
MLNIKNPEAHAVAQRAVALKGAPMTEAVTTALRERLARLEETAVGGRTALAWPRLRRAAQGAVAQRRLRGAAL